MIGRCQLRGFLVALALVLLTGFAVLAAPEFPKLTSYVNDRAGLLDSGEVASITADLEALEKKSTDQLFVVTVNSLQGYDIADYGVRLMRSWGVGQKNKNNGVLLIVAPKERKVRIEVGYGLEGVLTDARSKLIIENVILPRFKQGDFPGGVRAGVRDIIAILTGDAEGVEERAKGGRTTRNDDLYLGLFIFTLWIAIFLFAVFNATGSLGRRGAGGVVILPGGTSGGSSRGWSGGSGGWGGGGGGFGGGGGGSGGGGGASGSW